MDIKVLMGRRARAAREAASLTQTQAAEQMGITRQTLARMEKGEVAADGVQLVAMAGLFDRPVAWFYDQRELDDTALAFRADNPASVDAGLKQRLLDRLAAIADLEVAAGQDAGPGLPPTEPITKAGKRELEIVRAVAQEERGRLGVGDRGPVSDPVALLESIDVRVIPFEAEPGDGGLLSGFSAFSAALGAGIFVNVHPLLSVEHQLFRRQKRTPFQFTGHKRPALSQNFHQLQIRAKLLFNGRRHFRKCCKKTFAKSRDRVRHFEFSGSKPVIPGTPVRKNPSVFFL